MNTDQILVFIILFVTLGLFLWNRWRYDLVAIFALLLSVFGGLIPAEEAFLGFGHPAVITVAAVLLISRGLLNAGVVSSMAALLTRVGDRPGMQVAVLSGIVAFCSGFMNNVGALALVMPVGIWMARQSGRSPSYLLMPIAFASLLGGTLTLIGTPPNIIVSSFRQQTEGAPLAMFDFLPVGGLVTIGGLIFISLMGWRLIPRRESGNKNHKDLFEVSAYLTELRLGEGSPLAGQSLYHLMETIGEDADYTFIAVIRDGHRLPMPSNYMILKERDIFLVEADTDNLRKIMDKSQMQLAAEAENRERGQLEAEGLELYEVIVGPSSLLVGRSAGRLELRNLYEINVLAVARDGSRLRERIDKIRFEPGDILLVQASEDTMQNSFKRLGCLPLASRGLSLGRPPQVMLAALLFGLTLALIALNAVSAAVGMSACALAMILIGLVKVNEIYESIEMPVIVLLAAMLPIGGALESTGGSKLIASWLLVLGQSISPAAMLAILIAAVMLLANILNHAATAVLASPVAIELARGLEVSTDPFLMAVVIGASCTFLTPIGHQSNTLVMTPGGYKFGDYWRMGLPLSILVIIIAVAAIMLFWPLRP